MKKVSQCRINIPDEEFIECRHLLFSGAHTEFLETTNDAEMTFVADLEKRRTGIFDLCIPFSSKKKHYHTFSDHCGVNVGE